MNDVQNQAFSQLLAAWRRRETARDARNFRQLADARFDLDGARNQMRSTFIAPR
jgi:hypothetical protein